MYVWHLTLPSHFMPTVYMFTRYTSRCDAYVKVKLKHLTGNFHMHLKKNTNLKTFLDHLKAQIGVYWEQNSSCQVTTRAAALIKTRVWDHVKTRCASQERLRLHAQRTQLPHRSTGGGGGFMSTRFSLVWALCSPVNEHSFYIIPGFISTYADGTYMSAERIMYQLIVATPP